MQYDLKMVAKLSMVKVCWNFHSVISSVPGRRTATVHSYRRKIVLWKNWRQLHTENTPEVCIFAQIIETMRQKAANLDTIYLFEVNFFNRPLSSISGTTHVNIKLLGSI